MTKRVWTEKSVSIIMLPSGELGTSLLTLAEEWSRSWLLTPALWLLSDAMPQVVNVDDIDRHAPPDLIAYLLGRDELQNPMREQVDLFWTLGSQEFEKIRFIAVRTEQDEILRARTDKSAKAAATYIKFATPIQRDRSTDELDGVDYQKYNLVIAPTNERALLSGVVDQFWDKNLIAAAEDRATPLSTDSFVKIEQRFLGFALAHIATTAGLWTGLPISSAEIESDDRSQLNQARLQRVFVRGVTSDTLSADIANSALQKLNSLDGNFQVGSVDGKNIETIPLMSEKDYIDKLVSELMNGIDNNGVEENFLYKEYIDLDNSVVKLTWSKRFVVLLRDMANGISSVFGWIRASANYRLERLINDNNDESILYKAIPARLAPIVKLPPVDVVIASARPRMRMPNSALWTKVRESISSSIDAAHRNHPIALKDAEKVLVFADVDRVLPDPNAKWIAESFQKSTSIELADIGWLDPSELNRQKYLIEERIEELSPGLMDAKQQLSETQKLVDEAAKLRAVLQSEVDLLEQELGSDLEFNTETRNHHTHELPKDIAGPPRSAPQFEELNIESQLIEEVNRVE